MHTGGALAEGGQDLGTYLPPTHTHRQPHTCTNALPPSSASYPSKPSVGAFETSYLILYSKGLAVFPEADRVQMMTMNPYSYPQVAHIWGHRRRMYTSHPYSSYTS